MALEPFLINPPKRKPSRKVRAKRKKSNAGLKRHRIVAFENKKTGGLFTSSSAKIVRKGIKINPFRRNPFGEELMFIGANPKRKGGVSMAAKRKRSKRSYRKNPAKRRGRKMFRLNPVMDKSILYMILSAGVAGLATRMIPNLLGWSGWKSYALQAGILVGGGIAAKKFMGEKASLGVMAGAGTIIVVDATKSLLTGSAQAVASYENATAAYELAGPSDSDSAVMASGPYQNTM